MYSVLELAEQDTSLKKVSRNEYAGPCPSCHGTDRFRVRCNPETGTWAFMCRSCYHPDELLPNKGRRRGWGDAYAYLRHFRKMEHTKIKMLLSELQETLAAPRNTITRSGYESEVWQTMVSATVEEYEKALWSSEGGQALEYMRTRGLQDDIIRKAHLGYSQKGGVSRLLIPVYNNGRYVAIYRRDLRPDCSREERWKDAPGGTKEELYLADCLKTKRPTILVEAAIDALSLVQECGSLVNVVATGSVDGARSVQSLAKLALMPTVYVAFDADTAGDNASKWWLKRLPRSKRLRPFLQDINDMLMDGWDIRAWVSDALSVERVDESPKQPTLLIDQQEESATFPEPSLVQVAAPPLHDSTKVTMVTAQEKPSSLPSPPETETSDIRAQVLALARQAVYPLHNIHHTVEARGQVEYEKAIAQCPESYLPRLLAKLQKDIESLPPTPVAMPVETQPVTPEENRVVNALAQLFDAKVEIRPLVDGNPTQPWTPKEVQAHTKLEKSNLYCSQCWDAYSAQSIYKRATQHDANDVGYCEKCWQERQFHSSILLAYGKKYDWPFLRTLTTTVEGQTAYELFTLTAKPLDIMEAASTARRLDVFVVPDIVETYVPKKKKEKFENIDIAPNSGDTLDCLVHDIKQLWTAMPQHYENRKKYCHTEMQLWIENGIWTLVTLRECKKRVQDALKTKDIETLQKTRFAMRDILESVCHGHKW